MSTSENPNTKLPDFDSHWDYSNPAETEKKFREFLPLAESSGNREYHAALLTQIARTRGLQREFDDAHAILDSVEIILSDEMIVASIRYLLERGRVYNSAGEKEKTTPLFKKALKLASEHAEEFYAVDAAHMLGIVTPPEEQLDWNTKAMVMAEESEDEKSKKWLGSLYNNIGWTYHDLKDYENALFMFKKGLKWREARNDEKGGFIAKWTIARTYRSLERFDEAIALLVGLKAEMEAEGKEKDGYVYEELGENYLATGQTEASKNHFHKAHILLSEDKWLQANESDRLERILKLSQ